MTDDLAYWLALLKINGLGAVRFKKLIAYFPDMRSAWTAARSDLLAAGLEPALAANVVAQRENIDPAREVALLEREGLLALTVTSPDYPSLLKEIYAPPPVLFYRGELVDRRDASAIAVVGTRKHTHYGERAARVITAALALQGLTIVSGLALGIDALAHRAALENGGRTIAVIGSGLDQRNIYPAANRLLADKIVAAGGLILSEYPPGTMPLRGNFPQRNRVIAGLALGTLIIEAPLASGALTTAQYALESNREVLAVPGSIFSDNSLGTNNLIRLGARLVNSADDVLEALNLRKVIAPGRSKDILPDNAEEAALLGVLGREPIHIDDLIKASGLTASQASSALMLMEIKGKVRNLGNMLFVLA